MNDPQPEGHMASPQGREACGFASRAVEQVRARHQRLDRQDARPHHAGQTARGRRRGDRVRQSNGGPLDDPAKSVVSARH
jgi:hypothetical protein